MMATTRPRGWWYPWIIVAFFTVVVSVNGFMIYKATGTFTGLETEGAYVKGLKYNDNIEGMRRQAELGWTDQTTFVATGENREGLLQVIFKTKDGNPLSGLKATALVTRPTYQGYDFEVAIPESRPGVYGTPITLPLPGQWDIRIIASQGENDYQRVQRILVE